MGTATATENPSTLENQLREVHADVATLNELVSLAWDRIRSGNLYAGQPRNSATTRSLSLAELTLEAANRSHDPRLIGEAHRMVAYSLNANEQYAESIDHYREAIASLEFAGELRLASRTRLGLTAALFMSGKYSEAVDAAQIADRCFAEIGDEDGRARLNANLGNLYHRLDQHLKAVDYQSAAIEAFGKLKNSHALAQCHLNLGAALSMLDRFDEANGAYLHSEQLSQRLGLEELYAQARYNRVYLTFLRGQYGQAITGFQELREYYVSIGSERFIALCDLDEAEIYLQLNLPRRALELARSATEICGKIGLRYEQAKALTFAALALAQDDKFSDALNTLDQARDIFSLERNRYWTAALDLFRAHIFLLTGRASEANLLAAAAKNQFEELHAPTKIAMSIVLMTRADLAMQRHGEARLNAAEILRLIEQNQIPLHLFTSYSVCGEVEEQIGNSARAMEFYKLAAAEAEVHRRQIDRDELRVTFTEDKQQVYESLVRLSLDAPGGALEAYEWCERAKSRSLVDLISTRETSVRPESLQRSLPEGQTLVEYFVIQDEVIAFSISKDQITVHRGLCSMSELHERREWLAFHMERLIVDPSCVKADEASLVQTTNHHLRALYLRLVEPVVRELQADHLVIIPHGIMHDLPFHAFYDGEQYLIDRYMVSYAPSGSVFHHCMEKKDVSGEPLLMGVADDQAPFIDDEIHELRKIVSGARVFAGPAATRETFRREAESSSFVHIATHSIFRRDDPMMSSFRLADGWLSALDLFSMRCEANLVTLSGCKSGINQVAGADELLGLARGLLYAGARSLLLSLWDLNDQATAAFMSVFYREWLNGSTKAQAVRSAAQEIRKTKPHPFYWAPFYLVGKP